jgi:hypothetical protein
MDDQPPSPCLKFNGVLALAGGCNIIDYIEV